MGVPGILKELWWFKSTIVMVATPILLSIMLPFYKEMGLTQQVNSTSFPKKH